MLQDPVAHVSGTRDSRALLHRGDPAAFVEALSTEARQHAGVRHPYLERLESGDLPDLHWAIRDFCHQYWFYSAGFPAYLEAVIGGLRSASHREVLKHNLEEERGMDAASPDHVPHTELFLRFRRAAGVTDEYDARTPACVTALLWRDLFLRTCGAGQPGVGVGAIGIGTEWVVSTIYRSLHRAVTRHTGLSSEDYRFLTLHIDCDDEHAEQLVRISVELAEDPGQREALRLGVLTSLNLRSAFWDAMLARALAR